MTANRMGLEQTLSDERLEDLAKGQYFFARGAYEEAQAMARELLAYRKASKKAVTDVVAWNKPGEERKCDIRWRRFDVAPGPLYEAPPLLAVTVPDEPTDDERLMEIEGVSVVKLPTEFHSEHGVVVQLEKVMAALAVHGIKYERRHQKVVGLRAGIDAIRAEGIDVDAEKINAEKCHK